MADLERLTSVLARRTKVESGTRLIKTLDIFILESVVFLGFFAVGVGSEVLRRDNTRRLRLLDFYSKTINVAFVLHVFPP